MDMLFIWADGHVEYMNVPDLRPRYYMELFRPERIMQAQFDVAFLSAMKIEPTSYLEPLPSDQAVFQLYGSPDGQWVYKQVI